MVLDKLYYASADVVKQTLDKKASLRSAVYGSSFKNKRQLLRICCETLKNRNHFDQILTCAPLRSLLKEPAYADVSMLYVLLYEFLFGNGLRKCSKELSAPIFALKEIIRSQQSNIQNSSQSAPSVSTEINFPRYGRINTLKFTKEEAVEALTKDGWFLEEMSVDDETESFRNCIANMKSDQIYYDCHIPNLLIFPCGTDLHDYWMVEEGYIILQDKSSCLSSFLLKVKPNSHVIDVCAAPGMKTSHLAAILENKGKIWAMDKALARVETMRLLLDKAGVRNVSVFCGDCLRLDVDDKKFAKVEYALVDPPCSGSGIVKRMDFCVNDVGDINEDRLRSLSNLQAMILKHVMKLPALKRVVYSTCSVFEQENEKVIEEVLSDETLSNRYKLCKVLPFWGIRGSSSFSFGKKCIRTKPEITLTNGFFVAVFKRRKQVTKED